MTDQVVVDLAAAQDEPGHLLGIDAGLGQHRLETAFGELLEPARRLGQTQQALGRHDHERPLLGDPRLAAQQMEVLGGRGAVGDADVAFRGQLQEALETRR